MPINALRIRSIPAYLHFPVFPSTLVDSHAAAFLHSMEVHYSARSSLMLLAKLPTAFQVQTLPLCF